MPSLFSLPFLVKCCEIGRVFLSTCLIYSADFPTHAFRNAALIISCRGSDGKVSHHTNFKGIRLLPHQCEMSQVEKSFRASVGAEAKSQWIQNLRSLTWLFRSQKMSVPLFSLSSGCLWVLPSLTCVCRPLDMSSFLFSRLICLLFTVLM